MGASNSSSPMARSERQGWRSAAIVASGGDGRRLLHLRLPLLATVKGQAAAAVDGALEEMGLADCADRPFGNWYIRGISGGEKKRLSITLEVLIRASLLFLDEPTGGLDSSSAFFVTLTLRQMAREGRTEVASVHQPSSEMFTLFDDLCLLSGGETVYFGDAKHATESGELAQNVSKIIDFAFVDKVDMSEVQDEFSALITKSLMTLVHGSETKFDAEMIAMTRVPWGTLESVGDQSVCQWYKFNSHEQYSSPWRVTFSHLLPIFLG